MSARLAPTGSALSEEFWTAARQCVLVSCWCPACECRFFIPEPICPACGEPGWTWKPSEGVGVLYSFSVVAHNPDPAFVVPYILAVVDLDDGWTMLTHLVGCDLEEVRIGASVRVHFTALPNTDGQLLPTFRLIRDRDAVDGKPTA